jgi:transposase
MQKYPIVGLDVSKQTLDVFLLEASGDHRTTTVRNSEAGFRKLQEWLAPHPIESMTVCLEATNVYSFAVSTFFYEQQATVYLANPSQVAAYMRTELRRVKTDIADAESIAHFAVALAHRLRPWQPMPEQYQELRDLVRYLHELTRSRARVKNRREKTRYLTSATASLIKSSITKEIEFYDRSIKVLHRAIKKCLDRYPDLSGRYNLLRSAPGIGPISAVTIMAEIPNMRQFQSARQLAAYAGLTPRIRHSGKHQPVSQSISKIGNAQLRSTCYMAALTAKRHNAPMTAFSHRLQIEHHKKPKVVVIAVARKLLHLLYAMEKHQMPFNENYQNCQLSAGTI